MQTDTSPDSPLTITEAAAVCPHLRGRRLHVSTLWRWMRRGCKARNGVTIRLAHSRVGGTLTTTRTNLDRFFSDLANADLESFKAEDTPAIPRRTAAPTTAPKPVKDSIRRAQIARAEKTLNDAGI